MSATDTREPATTAPETSIGIRQMAEQTGLSQDALRWYEREGLIPAVPRDGTGRRAYDEATVRMVRLLVRLRRTGMPVAQMKEFTGLVAVGASTHGRRMTLLSQHRLRLLEQLLVLREDLAAVDDKITHYRELIDSGLDCAGEPIDDPRVIEQQRSLR
ncbi:MerR family transcriptional regulator [Dermacoccaceae bacterium W4C1]